MAFGSTLAHEEALPEDVWHERAGGGAADSDRATFIAEQDGEWVGLATGLAEADAREVPRVLLISMYVAGTARRRGVAAALVESVVQWARGRGTRRVALWVTSTNEAAVTLYGRCGFRPSGTARPLAHTPTLTEREMIRDL
jgi:GNAT superfamily N-acetyltransferase